MKVPGKIYLQVCGDCNSNNCNDCKFEDVEDNVTWCKDRIFNKDVEYTRTDAFIEKVCGWLKKNRKNYSTNQLGEEYLIEDFRKAMEE